MESCRDNKRLPGDAHERTVVYFDLAGPGLGPEDSLFTPVPSLISSAVRYEVNFWVLRRRFLETVEQFHKSLMDRTNCPERKRFVQALPELRPHSFY